MNTLRTRFSYSEQSTDISEIELVFHAPSYLTVDSKTQYFCWKGYNVAECSGQYRFAPRNDVCLTVFSCNSADVRPILEEACFGKSRCQIDVMSLDADHHVMPCLEDMVSYLGVDYICVSVYSRAYYSYGLSPLKDRCLRTHRDDE